MNCLQCNKTTNNPKFCSKSCAAKFNNVKYPKRTTTRLCSRCKTSTVKDQFSRICSNCSDLNINNVKKEEAMNRTLAYYKVDLIKEQPHRVWQTSVRTLARSWNKELTKMPCSNCGYSKHIQLCHIKPIKDFSDDALLKDVNSPDNIIQLCPNCHWEFDHGLLNLKEIEHAR